MNLRFVFNEYILIWYLLFHQSISEELNDYKQKIWNNYYNEYKFLGKEKKQILKDPKNYIPDDDTIYEVIREFDLYGDIYRKTESYKQEITRIWDLYKKRVSNDLEEIIRFDIKQYFILLINPDLSVIDLSSDNNNKIKTIVYGKCLEKTDIDTLLEIVYSVLKKEFMEFNPENQDIVDAILELVSLNELGTRLMGYSNYSVGKSSLKLIKRQIYPYFLMYLGIDRDDLVSYMRRDGIIFDLKNYTNEIQLRKINLKEFMNFCINNKRIIIKLDELGVI